MKDEKRTKEGRGKRDEEITLQSLRFTALPHRRITIHRFTASPFILPSSFIPHPSLSKHQQYMQDQHQRCGHNHSYQSGTDIACRSAGSA